MSTFCLFGILSVRHFVCSTFCLFDIMSVDILSVDILSVDILSYNLFYNLTRSSESIFNPMRFTGVYIWIYLYIYSYIYVSRITRTVRDNRDKQIAESCQILIIFRYRFPNDLTPINGTPRLVLNQYYSMQYMVSRSLREPSMGPPLWQ